MNIFVINSGSSSIKYQLINMPSAQLVCSGLVERIGQSTSAITHKIYKPKETEVHTRYAVFDNHSDGLSAVAALLTDKSIGVITNPNDIQVVGHRVVHGGESFSATVVINHAVKEKIKSLFSLAPLHNPANFLGIEVAEKIFTAATQVAVFDTAFHQTMSAKAYRYAIPGYLYYKDGIRAYGFHGTSHKYVSEKAADYLQKQESKIITIHLGNGCSMAAVNNGACIDNSMGLGPINGLIMGTRSGDIDPSVIFHMANQLGYSLQEINEILNKKSGMLGLCGYSDMRDIRAEIEKGNAEAALAYEMYAYRIKKYIGSFAAALNGLDAIVFTAGVGENDQLIRKMACENMQYLGIHFDEEKNCHKESGIREINTQDSPVKILVIPTNEELEIAKQCYQLLAPTNEISVS